MAIPQASRTPLLFADTSVCIARLLHAPSARTKIDATTKSFRRTSGLVSRKEFRRRVLGTAEYLLRELEMRGLTETNHKMVQMRANPHESNRRRAGICLELMIGITGKTLADQEAKLKTRIRTLLLTGLDQFDRWLDWVSKESGCRCGSAEVKSRTNKKNREVFDIGPTRCEELSTGTCGTEQFLADNEEARKHVLGYLRSLPKEDKTKELEAAEAFLNKIEHSTESAASMSPCATVGDAIIALEAAAAGADQFYTMNWKESQHLCRSLSQSMIVRPPNGEGDDKQFQSIDMSWPPIQR